MEGYPKPGNGKTYEEMLPEYTFALGKTDAVEKIMQFLNEQVHVANDIKTEQESIKDYSIG